MRYYFDSSTWITFFEHSKICETLVDAFRGGRVEISIHQENIRELVENPEIDEAKALRNRTLLEPFLPGVEADGIFVIGHSALGTAKIPNEDAAKVFDKHLKQKTKKEKALDDAIHLVNSLDGDSTLVTCDKQVKSTASSEGLSWLCLRDFLDRNGWPTEGDLPCASCRK